MTTIEIGKNPVSAGGDAPPRNRVFASILDRSHRKGKKPGFCMW